MGLLAPAGTPREIVDKLHSEIQDNFEREGNGRTASPAPASTSCAARPTSTRRASRPTWRNTRKLAKALAAKAE